MKWPKNGFWPLKKTIYKRPTVCGNCAVQFCTLIRVFSIADDQNQVFPTLFLFWAAMYSIQSDKIKMQTPTQYNFPVILRHAPSPELVLYPLLSFFLSHQSFGDF